MFVSSEVQPDFTGEDEALLKYIIDNFHVPNKEKYACSTGKIYVQFVINKEAKVEDVKVIRGIKDAVELNAEAIRVISEMPIWKPGFQNGKPAKVQFTLPINLEFKK
jgi:protein TonB